MVPFGASVNDFEEFFEYRFRSVLKILDKSRYQVRKSLWLEIHNYVISGPHNPPVDSWDFICVYFGIFSRDLISSLKFFQTWNFELDVFRILCSNKLNPVERKSGTIGNFLGPPFLLNLFPSFVRWSIHSKQNSLFFFHYT